jgi:hypothetical protein
MKMIAHSHRAGSRAATQGPKSSFEPPVGAKVKILDFGLGLKSQEPGAGKEDHRNLVLVPQEILEY